MTTTECPTCGSDQRIHYYATNESPNVLVTRCGACGWRSESETKRSRVLGIIPLPRFLQRLAEQNMRAMF